MKTRHTQFGSGAVATKFAIWACAVFLGATACYPPLAQANIRAPELIWQAPSSALSKAANLEVLGETLQFDCGEESCAVKAIYSVRADRPMDLGFEFILPVQTAVNALVAGRDAITSVTQSGSWMPGQRQLWEERRGKILPLYRASFRGSLSTGTNTIEVSYVQPLGHIEAEHGYFTASRWIAFFEYDLQPLKEWSLAKDFALNLSVSIPHRPSGQGLWSYIFSKSRSIECSIPGATVSEQNDKIVYTAQRGSEFPDQLNCYLGEHDLLVRYSN